MKHLKKQNVTMSKMYQKLINLGMENLLICLRNEYKLHGISTFHLLVFVKAFAPLPQCPPHDMSRGKPCCSFTLLNS